MSNVQTHRLAYLKYLYEKTGGDPLKFVPIAEVMGALSLSPDVFDAAENVLLRRDMISNVAVDSGREVCLTDRGIAEYEASAALMIDGTSVQPAPSTDPTAKFAPTGEAWYAVVGHVWDSLATTKHRLIYLGLLFALAVGSFSLGLKVASYFAQNKFESLEVKHERQLAALEKEQTKPIEYSLEVVSSDRHPHRPLPDLDEAPVDKRSMAEYGEQVYARKEQEDKRTSLTRGSIYDKDIGKRFQWTGTISDIRGGTNWLDLQLRTPLRRDGWPDSLTVTCLFDHDKYRSILEKLELSQTVTVTGVMNEHGNLTQCRLIEVP